MQHVHRYIELCTFHVILKSSKGQWLTICNMQHAAALKTSDFGAGDPYADGRKQQQV